MRIDRLVEFDGPDAEGDYKLVVEGERVPFIIVREGPDPTAWELILDSRFAYDVPKSAAGDVFLLVANAIAVASGYSAHGPNRRPITGARGVARCGDKPPLRSSSTARAARR